MRKAFTLIELVFVIVVIGILAKFGTNILLTTYTAYTQSSNNNKLLADAALTIKIIANRLQYRIRDSIISGNALGFTSLSAAAVGDTRLEWIGYDIDGWLGSAGSTNPNWSGFIDVNNNAAFLAKNYLESPQTNTVTVNTTIQSLSPGALGTGLANSAIFFTGANNDINSSYGWNAIVQNFQSTTAAHRVNGALGFPTQLFDATAGPSSFINTDVYENYKLAWTAYAISHEDFNGDGAVYPATHPTLSGQVILDLVLYYDYQPWEGERFNGGARVLLLKDVDTFVFRGIGNSILIQVCTSNNDALGDLDGGYSICQETTIF